MAGSLRARVYEYVVIMHVDAPFASPYEEAEEAGAYRAYGTL